MYNIMYDNDVMHRSRTIGPAVFGCSHLAGHLIGPIRHCHSISFVISWQWDMVNQRPWYVQPCLCVWVIKGLGMSSRVCVTG